MLNRLGRQLIAQENLGLNAEIIASFPGASTSYAYYPTPPPALPPLPTENDAPLPPVPISVVNSDTLAAARAFLTSPTTPRIAVLNMASERSPGGHWTGGSLAQEEALCFSSTLPATLARKHYRLPPRASIWSPGVVVYRDEVAKDCALLPPEDRFLCGVATVPGLRRPALSPDGLGLARKEDLVLLEDKIRLAVRMFAMHGATHVVLGALGCGVFANPRRLVAETFKAVLGEKEFRGRFEALVFAVLDVKGERNYEVFREVLEGVVVG
ncbi:MAG: hypothetical protein M1829_003610 [Trizodia sp. TS-e1964]|nr:MAG: hypothetical protein M1829_003610 [Trizodia sp. TS-e1964]